MEGGACPLRHFLGRWSVLCVKGSLWSWSFDDLLLGAKATCEAADRERIAEEAERKICFSENGITSNSPTRPYFPRDMPGHMALAETLLMPQQKAPCYWRLRQCHPWTTLGFRTMLCKNGVTSLELGELSSVDSNHEPLDVQPELFLNLMKLLWGRIWWYVFKMAFGFICSSGSPRLPHEPWGGGSGFTFFPQGELRGWGKSFSRAWEGVGRSEMGWGKVGQSLISIPYCFSQGVRKSELLYLNPVYFCCSSAGHKIAISQPTSFPFSLQVKWAHEPLWTKR